MTSAAKKITDARIQVIFVGTSAGGVTAIQHMLRQLPKGFPIPIVFVQHLPADATLDPHLIFSRHFEGKILEAIDKMPIERGHIYFAPPAYHLSVEKDLTLSLSQDDPVHFARPSIDVMFESVAQHVGPRACAILLTGANNDGASGLKAVQAGGGYTMVQDPASAEAPMMPRTALSLMTPDFVGTIEMISQSLSLLAERETQ